MSQITFLWGHPVPYSVTVQRNGRSVNDARRYVEQFREHMRQSEREQFEAQSSIPPSQRQQPREVIVRRVDGAYIFYDHMPEGFARPRFSVAAIDVGFDVRVQNMLVEYPHDGPVVLEYSTDTRGTDKPSEKIVRLCDSRAEALRVLRRHGYRVLER